MGMFSLGFSDIFLFVMLIALLGAFIFLISALINVFRKKPALSNLDFRRMLIFIAVALLFFLLFGLSL